MLRINRRDTTSIPSWMLVGLFVSLAARIGISYTNMVHPPKPTEQVAWLKTFPVSRNYDEKPLLYYFRADWSSACTTLEQSFFNNKNVVRLINQNFRPIKVTDKSVELGQNDDNTRMLEQKYEVTNFPTVVFTLSDGTLMFSLQQVSSPSIEYKEIEHRVVHELPFWAALVGYSRGDFKKSEVLFNRYLQDDFIKEMDNSTDNRPSAMLYRYACLKYLQRHDEAKQLLDNALAVGNSERSTPSFEILQYFAGLKSYEDICHDNNPEVDGQIAIVRFGEKKYAECSQHLARLLPVTSCQNMYTYKAAQTLVNKLPPALNAAVSKTYPH